MSALKPGQGVDIPDLPGRWVWSAADPDAWGPSAYFVTQAATHTGHAVIKATRPNTGKNAGRLVVQLLFDASKPREEVAR